MRDLDCRTDPLGVTVRLLQCLAGTRSGEGAGGPHFEGSIDWEAVVALASAHLVLPALDAALRLAPDGDMDVPADARAFFADMAAANAARNRALADDLKRIADLLASAGIPVVALKGAAFILDDARRTAGKEPLAPWRFSSDLDLLVPPPRLHEAGACLVGAGYRPAADCEPFDPERDAHLPPLWSPGGTHTVELHGHLFAPGIARRLDEGILARSLEVACGAMPMRIPAAADRIAIVLAHSQVHHRFHAARRILLRDLLDLSHLASPDGSALVADALTRLEPGSERDAARALVLASSEIMAWPVAGITFTAGDRAFVRAAIRRLEGSRLKRRVLAAVDDARIEARRLVAEPGRVRRLMSIAVSPQMVRSRISRRAGKRRQAHWG
ncbi:MAG: nucleotidyltransferase family protein [Hyphomicrobiaceae bacterium]